MNGSLEVEEEMDCPLLEEEDLLDRQSLAGGRACRVGILGAGPRSQGEGLAYQAAGSSSARLGMAGRPLRSCQRSARIENI